jgi:hypothetical protein
MSENEMTCAQLSGVSAELALGVLTGRERAMALAHLDHCEACREEVRQLMVTGEQLRELLPPAEPPAGFETRVLDRLGLTLPPGAMPAPGTTTAAPPVPQAPPVPSGLPGLPRPGEPPRGHAELLRAGRRNRRLASSRPARDGARPGGTPGGTRPARTSRLRRALAGAALGLALLAAGLGGWRIGAGSPSSPAGSSAAAPLTSASLLSATHRSVGQIYLYSGTDRWLYMSVDLGSGDETVTCQVIGAGGGLTTVGSFQLTGGYGGWGSPDPGNAGTLHGARLVAADGTVLATATFSSW